VVPDADGRFSSRHCGAASDARALGALRPLRTNLDAVSFAGSSPVAPAKSDTSAALRHARASGRRRALQRILRPRPPCRRMRERRKCARDPQTTLIVSGSHAGKNRRIGSRLQVFASLGLPLRCNRVPPKCNGRASIRLGSSVSAERCGTRVLNRGGTRRSQVQILPPLLQKGPGNGVFPLVSLRRSAFGRLTCCRRRCV
jgi:hypothetical protein